MALYADLRFAAVAARGFVTEHGIAWMLPRLIGEAIAMDLLLTARTFTGTEAAEMGPVNKSF